MAVLLRQEGFKMPVDGAGCLQAFRLSLMASLFCGLLQILSAFARFEAGRMGSSTIRSIGSLDASVL